MSGISPNEAPPQPLVPSSVDTLAIERLAKVVDHVANEWPFVSGGRLSEAAHLRGIAADMRQVIGRLSGTYSRLPEIKD